MRVGKIIDKTYAEGPGCRFCIWVQGCNHRCDGCFAEEFQPYDGGTEIGIDEIKEMILKVEDFIDGITFLGGEPFDKAKELSEVAEFAKSLGKNVISFTGYTFERLNSPEHKKLIGYTDILIDGEFEKNRLDYSRPMVGSSNQRIIFLTDAIDSNLFYSYKNRLEVRVDDYGNLSFNGMGNIEKLKKYMDNLDI